VRAAAFFYAAAAVADSETVAKIVNKTHLKPARTSMKPPLQESRR